MSTGSCAGCAPTYRSTRGSVVEHDGKAVGTVTSAAGTVALAMLRREVEPATTVLVGSVSARVEAIAVDD